MAVISNGVAVKTTTSQVFTPASWNGVPQPGISLRTGWAGQFNLGTYGEMYRSQMWVGTVVDKLAMAHARLPLKVYQRDDLNRPLAPVGHPYAALLRRPSTTIPPYLFWLWTRTTRDIYGEACWLKVRDRGGRPVELIPWHPTRLGYDDKKQEWTLHTEKAGQIVVQRQDLVLFRTYNPDSMHRGLSKLERLRATLENEAGARRANDALWRQGGRPSVALKHPKTFSSDAVSNRIRYQWDEVHGGVDNWGKAVVLEEGMDAIILPLNAEELQYIEGRKLNREEVCANYDVPPPVLHILDRATFSNITEQMRSMYRDTMAPTLKDFESTMEHELRDGTMGRAVAPDFGEDTYAEFLMDEVLRGDFEARAAAYQSADWMTVAEKRRAENLPFIEGTDQLFHNSANVPMIPTETGLSVAELTTALQKIYLAVGTVIDAEEARAILNRAGAGLGPTPDLGHAPAPAPAMPAEQVRSVMGRLGRAKTLSEIDVASLLAGLPPELAEIVAVAAAAAADVPDLRSRVRALTTGGT